MDQKCITCKVNKRAMKSKTPACCKWYLDNVVILGKSVRLCPDYEPIKKKNKKKAIEE